jgi:hypothetical protein
LTPNKKFVRIIKERFNDEFIQTFGIEPDALTANEAEYLVGFKSIDTLRNRKAAAEQEIDRRLRSKGIGQRPEEEKAKPSSEVTHTGITGDENK